MNISLCGIYLNSMLIRQRISFVVSGEPILIFASESTIAYSVSVRADWHAAYGDSCWAFVPSIDILKKMEKIGRDANFAKVRSTFKCCPKITSLMYVLAISQLQAREGDRLCLRGLPDSWAEMHPPCNRR